MKWPNIVANFRLKLPFYYRRQIPLHFDDSKLTDEYQNEVYEKAYQLAIENQYKDILDVGCGSAFKLLKYFEEFNTTGIETEPCFSELVNKYPNRKWLLAKNPEKSIGINHLKADLVICSDVIEHFNDPIYLLRYLKNIDFKTLIISTPDRAVFLKIKKATAIGPPWNPCHAQEWTANEFRRLLKPHFNSFSIEHCTNQIECMYAVIRK